MTKEFIIDNVTYTIDLEEAKKQGLIKEKRGPLKIGDVFHSNDGKSPVVFVQSVYGNKSYTLSEKSYTSGECQDKVFSLLGCWSNLSPYSNEPVSRLMSYDEVIAHLDKHRFYLIGNLNLKGFTPAK